MKGCRPIKWTSNRSVRSCELDDYLKRGATQLDKKYKIVMMPIADFAVNQLNLWANLLSQQQA